MLKIEGKNIIKMYPSESEINKEATKDENSGLVWSEEAFQKGAKWVIEYIKKNENILLEI